MKKMLKELGQCNFSCIEVVNIKFLLCNLDTEVVGIWVHNIAGYFIQLLMFTDGQPCTKPPLIKVAT